MPGPQRRLDERRIVDEAFLVLQQAGIDGLSVRSVTSRLHISAAAFYTYFPGKQQLLRAMVEQVFHDIDPRTALAEHTWAEGIRRLALAMRERLAATSGAVALIMSGPLDGPRALAFNEVLLELFVRAGLSLDDAARAAYAFQVYVLGFIALQTADAPIDGELDEDDLVRARVEALQTWDVSAFPLTAQTGPVVAAYNSTAQFIWGLERLVAGIVQSRTS
jgi:AcrR family transcriptional regulator